MARTPAEQDLLEALEVVERLGPHTQSGWSTELFRGALEHAKVKAQAALERFLAETGE